VYDRTKDARREMAGRRKTASKKQAKSLRCCLAQRRSRVKTETEDSKRTRARLQGREYNGGLRTHRETGDDDGEGGEGAR